MDIRIDRNACMGSGNCGFWAPGTFDLDDDGYAVVIDPEGSDEATVRKAIDGCPTHAISLWVDGEKVAP